MNAEYIKEQLKNCLNSERYEHTLGVADCAVELAKLYGLDEKKAYLAGLLHDCAKCLSNDELLKIIKTELKEIKEEDLISHKTFHAPVGAHFAKNIYNVNDKEILDAISCHTIGKLNMSLFEKIIFLADKIETNTRDLEYCKKMRKILEENKGEKGLNMALFICFSNTIKSLVERKIKICKTTIDVYNELLELTK